MTFKSLSLVLVAALWASPGAAQVIKRSKAAEPEPAAAPASDDDDILAPVPTGEKKPEAPAKPKDHKVGLVPFVPLGDAGAPLAEQVTAGVTRELEASSAVAFSGLAVGSADAGADAGAADKAVADAKDLLGKARGLLDRVQLGKAKKGYELALAALDKGAGAQADPALAIEAYLGLAEVAARGGNEKEAAQHLRAVIALNPEYELDTKLPPAFLRSHQKERQALLAEPRGVLLVDPSGAGAQIEVDGRPTDRAPVRVRELPAGRHLVRALREGLPPWGTWVDVPAGGEAVVTPGFVTAGGDNPVDALAQNTFPAKAAAVVAARAKAEGVEAALVGVVQKGSATVTVQSLLVDQGGGVARLPSVTYQGDLLDISIESLRIREAIDEIVAAKDRAKRFQPATDAPLIEGAQVGAAARVAEMTMRYDVRAPTAQARSRMAAGDTAAPAPSGDEELGDGRRVLSAGERGTRARLDDDDDPYATAEDKKKAVVVEEVDPDAPLTEQGWFWPTVVGGSIAGLTLLAGGTVAGLLVAGVIPDPRPANGAEVRVTLPGAAP